MSLRKPLLFFIIFFGILSPSSFSFAANTTGNYKYAWSNNVGYINFDNMTVGDSALSGYAWSKNAGWIKFDPTNGGVTNNNGDLSGYAWGEQLGWINFNNVSIDTATGKFSGTATGDLIGTLTFDCPTYCDVRTDWRPAAVASSQPAIGGGSSWIPPSPLEPESGFKFFVTPKFTKTNKVTLNFDGGPDATKIAISDNSNFSPATYINYSTSTQWTLSGSFGKKTLYVKFSNKYGRYSGVLSDTVMYELQEIAQLPSPEVNPPTKSTIDIENILKILEPLVPGFLKPKQSEKPPQIPIEKLVAKVTPLAFQGKWQLLPPEPIREFVLSPLPKGIRNLAQKFPQLGKTLKEVGISKITDVAKLNTVKLTLPGLTERLGLSMTNIEHGKFALPKGIPVAKLSPVIKQQLPAEIVFAKTGGELIDFNVALSVTEKGEAQQKIATISGKPLQLVVKPDKPVKSVKGYVVFKSKTNQSASLELPRNSLLASVIFANPVFTKTQEQSVKIEEKLVLAEFQYTDPDGDGIYTAQIQAPLIEGEYEIITVMDFNDPELGKKEIRLTTVVDPEGYVYERDGDKETRIPGAIISLFWLNPETKQYELWPAKEYQQENPQTTDVRGTYSFLVPDGYYYLKVETPGYDIYDGKPFQVKEGNGIHINIELQTPYWWIKIIDWKTILLVVVIILLLYNFYRDKIRERLARSKNI